MTRINNIDIDAPKPMRMDGEAEGLCRTCIMLDIATCPIFDRAVEKGFAGMEKCECKEMVEKAYQAGKDINKGRL